MYKLENAGQFFGFLKVEHFEAKVLNQSILDYSEQNHINYSARA